jgi:hypothetical protein
VIERGPVARPTDMNALGGLGGDWNAGYRSVVSDQVRRVMCRKDDDSLPEDDQVTFESGMARTMRVVLNC